MVGARDYRAIDDVSILDIPLLASMKAALAAAPIAPVSEAYFVHKDPIAVSLGNDTSIDNLAFSGALPKDPQLRKRFAGVGAVMVLMPAIRHEVAQGNVNLEQVYHEFGISDSLPLRRNGEVDVEKALARVQSEIIRGDLRAEDLAQIETVFQSLVRKDLPIEMELRNSIAFLTLKGQDIIDSDPILKLTIGGDLSLWHFVSQIQRIFPNVNPSTISEMRWEGDEASFQCSTRLNNVRVRGQATAISINRIFFLNKEGDLFQVAQATLISGQLIDSVAAKLIHGDVRRLLSSSGDLPVKH
jgi:hypothetical protein